MHWSAQFGYEGPNPVAHTWHSKPVKPRLHVHLHPLPGGFVTLMALPLQDTLTFVQSLMHCGYGE